MKDDLFKMFCPECDWDTWHETTDEEGFFSCTDCFFVHKIKNG